MPLWGASSPSNTTRPSWGLLRTKWHLDPSAVLPQDITHGGLLCPLVLGVWEFGPYLTQCHRGQGLPQYQVAPWSIQLFGHSRRGPKIGGCCAPFLEGELGPSNTVSPGPWSTSVPSGILIHPVILPQLFWFTSVNIAWVRSTYKPTANRCQHAPAVVFDPSVPVFWLFHAPDQTTAIIVLPSMDLVCGTGFLMNWDHLISLWLRSETNWRHYYLTCNCYFSAFVASAKVRFINALNNNNNNNNRHGSKIGELCPFFFWGGAVLGPHLTQCGWGRGLPPCQVSPWSIQLFCHNTPMLQTDRLDNGPVA